MNRRNNSTSLLAALILAIFAGASHAQDWPQFRGPNRDGVSLSKNLLDRWPESGPELLWTAEGAGRGYSSLAIADGKMLTLGDAPSTATDEDEHLLCFDVSTGKFLWKTKIGPAWKAGGPDSWQSSRSTPTVDGEHAYVLTAHGKLLCCTMQDGSIVWEKDLKEEFAGDKGDGWGYGESPLVDGDHVICTPGKEPNTMLALDKKTGDKIGLHLAKKIEEQDMHRFKSAKLAESRYTSPRQPAEPWAFAQVMVNSCGHSTLMTPRLLSPARSSEATSYSSPPATTAAVRC